MLKKFAKPKFYLVSFFVVAFIFTLFSAKSNDNDYSLSATTVINKEGPKQKPLSFLYQGEERKETPGVFSVQNNSLMAISPYRAISFQSLGSLSGEEISSHDETGIGEYVVQKGDTISSVARHFNISSNTILWANDLTTKSVISPGKKLIILPVDGAMRIVRKGDTISQVAKDYQVKKDIIIDFNQIPDNGQIFVGDILIIPGGKKPSQIKTYSVKYSASVPRSYFIVPVPSPWRITQGLHWYNAIDFSTGQCGSPVYASAGGVIQRTGYTSRGGNYVRILHPNGVVTYYGHLSTIKARIGQRVSQGAVIGYIGHTGHTIPSGLHGCHLHFDVRGCANPFAGLYRK